MARLSDADQGGLPVPRLDSGGSAGAGPGAVSGSGVAYSGAEASRHPGVAELLLQIADDGRGAVSGARFVYSVDETEEHAASHHGRGFDHASGAGVLRLSRCAMG